MSPELAQLLRLSHLRSLGGRWLNPRESLGLLRLAPAAEYPGAADLLLLGEAPGPNTRPDCPLFPHPPTSAGGRLLKILDLPLEVYFSVGRGNLVSFYPGPGGLPSHVARAQGAALLDGLKAPARVLGFGVKLRAALGLHDVPSLTWRSHRPGLHVAWAHHTSGLSRYYNKVSNQEALRRFVRCCLLREGEA